VPCRDAFYKLTDYSGTRGGEIAPAFGGAYIQEIWYENNLHEPRRTKVDSRNKFALKGKEQMRNGDERDYSDGRLSVFSGKQRSP